MIRPLVGVLVVVGLITGCAETKVAKHEAGGTPKRDRVVGYKVGIPYQIKGKWYYPQENFEYSETGIASWYGTYFHGRSTANGETYDMNALTAAHKTLPMPSVVRVTNLENGRSLKLRVNDRGPFVDGRIIDVSRRASQLLGFHHQGVARVKVDILGDESRVLAQGGSDRSLKATTASVSPARRNQGRAQTAAHTPRGTAVRQTYRQASYVPGGSAGAPIAAVGVKRDRIIEPTKNIYVQAGAFTYADRAEHVRAQLRDVGPVMISAVQRDGRELYRVRVGPLTSENEADRLLAAVVQAGFSTSHVVHE
jgi:rare lipoprotein A